MVKKPKKEPKKKLLYIWKCEDCGSRNFRRSPRESHRCDYCGRKGVQTYIGRG
jgi:ribosomal protein L37AE/L43A